MPDARIHRHHGIHFQRRKPLCENLKGKPQGFIVKDLGQKIKSLRHWDGLTVGWTLMRHSAQRHGEWGASGGPGEAVRLRMWINVKSSLYSSCFCGLWYILKIKVGSVFWDAPLSLDGKGFQKREKAVCGKNHKASRPNPSWILRLRHMPSIV